MENNIVLSEKAMKVVLALQHKNGTYCFYDTALSRMFNFILEQSDEIGMDATETIDILRAINCLKADLKDLAKAADSCVPPLKVIAAHMEVIFPECESQDSGKTETERKKDC